MKKLILIMLSTVFLSSLSASENMSSKYVDRSFIFLSLGKAKLEPFKRAASIGFDIRAEKQVFTENLFVGLGMGVDFFKPEEKVSGTDVKFQLESLNANLYPVISYDIMEGLNVSASFGYTRGRIVVKKPDFYPGKKRMSTNGYYFGLGVFYDISPKYRIGIDYKDGKLKVNGDDGKENFTRTNFMAGYKF